MTIPANTWNGDMQESAREFLCADGEVYPKDFLTEVNKGAIAGHVVIPIIGKSDTIGSSGFTDIWDEGGIQTLATSAETYEVVSDSASDTSAGTGTQTILLTSLDADFVAQITTATMNGTTPVTLSNTHIRPRLAVSTTAGSNGTNVGNITVRVSGGGDVRAKIPADGGISNNSQFTVPADTFGIAIQIAIFTPKGEDVTGRTRSRPFGTGTNRSEFSPSEVSLYQNPLIFPVAAAQLIPEKNDIKIQAKSTNENITLTTNFSIMLIDDDKINTEQSLLVAPGMI